MFKRQLVLPQVFVLKGASHAADAATVAAVQAVLRQAGCRGIIALMDPDVAGRLGLYPCNDWIPSLLSVSQ